jgi:hypothetical protein
MTPLLGLILLTSCTLETTIDGAVAGFDVSIVGTMYWGGKYLFFADEELDCVDLDFVHHTYTGGKDPRDGDGDFVALQFTFLDDPDAYTGFFSIGGDAPISGKLLVVEGGAFTEFRARSGSLTIDELEDNGVASGIFDVAFDDGTMTGTWETDFCVNLPD